MIFGFDILKGSQNLTLVYRIYYKVVITQIEPKALEFDTWRENLLLKASTEESHVVIQKSVKWRNIKPLERWIFQNEKLIKPLKPQELERIVKYENKEVEIMFNKYRITKIDFS